MNDNHTMRNRLMAVAATLGSVLAASAGETKQPPNFEQALFDTGLLMNSGVGLATISSARTTTHDVGDRLFRLRSGYGPGERTIETTAPPMTDAKGGMSKMPITTTTTSPYCWEVYGSLFYYTQDYDTVYSITRPGLTAAAFPVVVQGDGSLDMYGGNVGIERRLDENWAFGFAIGGSSADLDIDFVGSSDIDTLSLTPYVSYRREDALGSADFWADLMYSYGMHDLDTFRATGIGFASASPEGDTHQLELTSGINFDSSNLVHGPYAGLRWIDGEIDAYTEFGPGGAFFPSQDIESLASILGYQVSVPIRTGGGMLIPQFRAAWEHEFEDDPGVLFGLPMAALDEDVAVLGAALGWYGDCSWNVVLDYEARLGSDSESHYVSMKVGKEF